jgi:hypothetical protein
MLLATQNEPENWRQIDGDESDEFNANLLREPIGQHKERPSGVSNENEIPITEP